MSLLLYIKNADVPLNQKLIQLNDAQFDVDKDRMPVDDTVKLLMKKIDGSEYVDNTTIVTRYGEYLDMYYLSSGCKTAINVYRHPQDVVNCIEAGANAALEILQLNRGSVLMKTIPYCEVDLRIDVVLIYNGSKQLFHTMQELLNEWHRLEREKYV